MDGRILKAISLGKGEKQSITVATGDLQPGAYFYTLLVDGKKIDSKKMVTSK